MRVGKPALLLRDFGSCIRFRELLPLERCLLSSARLLSAKGPAFLDCWFEGISEKFQKCPSSCPTIAFRTVLLAILGVGEGGQAENDWLPP